MAYIESICGDRNDIIVKSFSQATDEEITEYLNLHRAGKINLHDFWTIGDERIIHINNITGISNIINDINERDITFVILHGPNAFDLSDSEGGGKNIFVIGLKINNRLTSSVIKINTSATNVGGWKESGLRPWCDNNFREALPTEVKKWFKKFKYKSSDGGGLDTSSIIENYFTLTSSYEYNETSQYVIESEKTVPFEYYKNNINKITSYYDGSYWNSIRSWLRSSYSNSTMFIYAYGYPDEYTNKDMTYTEANRSNSAIYNVNLFGVV